MLHACTRMYRGLDIRHGCSTSMPRQPHSGQNFGPSGAAVRHTCAHMCARADIRPATSAEAHSAAACDKPPDRPLLLTLVLKPPELRYV